MIIIIITFAIILYIRHDRNKNRNNNKMLLAITFSINEKDRKDAPTEEQPLRGSSRIKATRLLRD